MLLREKITRHTEKLVIAHMVLIDRERTKDAPRQIRMVRFHPADKLMHATGRACPSPKNKNVFGYF